MGRVCSSISTKTIIFSRSLFHKKTLSLSLSLSLSSPATSSSLPLFSASDSDDEVVHLRLQRVPHRLQKQHQGRARPPPSLTFIGAKNNILYPFLAAALLRLRFRRRGCPSPAPASTSSAPKTASRPGSAPAVVDLHRRQEQHPISFFHGIRSRELHGSGAFLACSSNFCHRRRSAGNLAGGRSEISPEVGRKPRRRSVGNLTGGRPETSPETSPEVGRKPRRRSAGNLAGGPSETVPK
ncbi:hypothetical protein ACLB2K_035844 [Fragaria x ananassa]